MAEKPLDGEVMGCTDSLAYNYNINATEDDGSCTVLDECGVCGDEGIQKEIVIAMEINSTPLAVRRRLLF